MQKTTFEGLNRSGWLDDDEEIIWQFKPTALHYIIGKNAIPWPFALLWAGFDSIFLIAFSIGSSLKEIWPALFFLAIHMMPVWIFIGSAIKLSIEHKAINYILTNKRVIETDKSTTLKALFNEINDVSFSESPISKLGAITFKVTNKQTIKFDGIKHPSKLYSTIRLIIDNKKEGN